MTKFITKRSLQAIPIILILGSILAIYLANSIINSATTQRLYSSTNTLPHNRVGLLLGTGKYLSDKLINPYYEYRIDAAVQIIKARKIDYLVISGDNGQKDYNEPMTMKIDLARLGIDTTKVYLDYAGFRTFDSIVRLKEIFGQDSVTIISQPFHNQRAIYIADKKGIFAIGYNAVDLPGTLGLKTNIREKLARVKVFIDLLFDKKPKFLGKKISIY